MQKSLHYLASIIEPAVKALGYDLWGCEFSSQGRHSLLRVYIDSKNGVSIKDCEQASRQIASVLDVEDAVKGKYNLEVSSPGIERPLYTLPQYQRYVGQKVQVRLHEPLDGKRNFNGVLEKVDGHDVIMMISDQQVVFNFEQIQKANLIVTM